MLEQPPYSAPLIRPDRTFVMFSKIYFSFNGPYCKSLEDIRSYVTTVKEGFPAMFPELEGTLECIVTYIPIARQRLIIHVPPNTQK
jgi:hypothetical protein